MGGWEVNTEKVEYKSQDRKKKVDSYIKEAYKGKVLRTVKKGLIYPKLSVLPDN